jgi:decaprenyl-phosphate phosphoribosyltransferase
MKIMLKLIRFHQWNKQALVILPLIALGNTVQISDLGRLICVAIAFSFVASSVYILNDLQDLSQDKLDAVKSKRPLASGEISVQLGQLVGLFLLFSGLLLAFVANDKTNRLQVMSLFFAYLVSNLIYSFFHLKRVRIIGLALVSLGFAIRFSIGTFVIELEFSTWAFVLIIQLAMFMLSGKRFQTFLRSPLTKNRELELQFWLLSMVTFAAFFAATYSGFISDPEVVAVWGKEALIASVLPLGIGLVRFVELVIHSEKYQDVDATESMTKDVFLLILVFLFASILFIGRLNA